MATSGGGVAAGIPQPQTTVEAAGGPFIRHSQPGRRPLYNSTAISFGGTGITTNPVPSAPGYYRGMRARVSVTGGTGSTAVYAADAPYNCASLVTVKDAFGTPLIVAPGYEAFYLIPKYGGQFGSSIGREISNLPSYNASANNLGPNPLPQTGNFSFNTVLPFEFAKAYGVISGANASLLPTITVNWANSTSVYSTAPGGTPVLNFLLDTDFYWLPEGVDTQPPGLGTTCQWVYQQANPVIGSAASTIVQFPRMGGYLSVIILELRDSTGARVDAWPQRPRIIVDGVPLIDSDLTEIYDDMFIQFQGTSRPAGVLAFSRRTSLAQEDFGLFDTGETYLSTNPGTLLEVQGAPWQTIANPPVTLSCIIGQVVPSGAMIQGLPEV
jgi:hypothetical protein